MWTEKKLNFSLISKDNGNMIFLDFEFNKVVEEKVNLVCGAFHDSKTGNSCDLWLHNKDSRELVKFIDVNCAETFVSFGVSAEARSLYAAGIDPYYLNWIDLHLEWRCITNHNDNLNWGKQLKDGKVINAIKPRPKWERVEGEASSGFKHSHSLAEATYKLLGEIRDTDHKNKMRDLIISAPDEFAPEEEADILAYCKEDVKFLPELFKAILNEYKKLLGRDFHLETLLEEMRLRGKYAALTGLRESWGYPINYRHTKNFSNQVSSILDDVQRDINSQFPDIKPFKYNKAKQNFSWNQIATKMWVAKNHDTEKWLKTDKDGLSLSLEAFQRFYDYKHDYPRGNFGAQIVRYLKLKQSLNGFVPGGKKSFWDAVGSDERVRPYMNIYGSQSSRSQPGSTSYILLKPAWQRSLLQPPEGKCITSIDYGSEEYFISALWYQDKKMIESYLSGDVYLAFAKQSGAVPPDATKESHKAERNAAKSTVLGLSYLMSKYGLSNKLTQDTGREWTPDEAQEQIDLFYHTYSDFDAGMKDFIEEYRLQGYFKGVDGWYMWGDNDNFRSIANVPIQYLGAAIMRKADMLFYERYGDKAKCVCTLHDALYIEHDHGDWNAIDVLAQCMIDAFAFYFPTLEETARKIRLDPFTWGPGLEEGSIVTPKGMKVDCATIYIDERAVSEYEKFSRYFQDREENDL